MQRLKLAVCDRGADLQKHYNSALKVLPATVQMKETHLVLALKAAGRDRVFSYLTDANVLW